MKDFKNYNPEPPEKPRKSEATPPESSAKNGNAPSEVNATVDLAKAMAKAMNGKSEGQLLRTIISEAERGKREGTLTNADLDNFYAALSPLVDGVKRKKLKEVISKLKEI